MPQGFAIPGISWILLRGMMMGSLTRFWLVLAVLALPLLGLAQGEPPTAQLSLPKSGKPGQKVKAIVKLTFAPGLHGYQNPPTKDYMIPVSIKSTVKDITCKPSYPSGVVKDFAGESAAVYEGTVEIPVMVTLPKKPGTVQIKLEVSYQQCNEQACYPPGTINLTGKISVKK
jgi:DsbC/DsbD-like thiol-disulfide interchange protein